MKLKDGCKRAPDSIKLEDAKIACDLDELLSSTENPDSDTDSHALCSGEFGSKDYYYRCDICHEKLPNLKSVLEHRDADHVNERRKDTIVKNLDIQPDVHSPDFYCESCEKYYLSKDTYRCHLRGVHFMVLKPLYNRKARTIDNTPNPNDPNFYCRACKLTCAGKGAFRRHCKYAHGLNPAKYKSPISFSSGTAKSHCQICDKHLSNVTACRRHYFLIHKMDIRQAQQEQKNIMPNVNLTDLYCYSCEKKLANETTFERHLQLIHSIFKSAPPENELKPDIDDPNNYCRACQKTFCSRGSYRTHLRVVHQMTLSSLKSNEQLPDPYNRDYYCSVCKKKYPVVTLYRRHCKEVHFMTLKHPSIVNPNAEINVNDPKLHCAQCERSFCNKVMFKRHLIQIHGIEACITRSYRKANHNNKRK
ncbi:hypothetical protein FB192DRAFT_1365123 [Mucor lusitanicus]|nr:hypothetical protein FB192DRAFT_1365123 [Mucor lusitanicus]